MHTERPSGFTDPTYPDHVCLLKWSLYDLKQAPHAWFDRLSQFILFLGFYCSKADSSLFIYCHGAIITIFFVYIDDILVIGNDDSFVNDLLHQLGKEFAIKDLGSFWYFFGYWISNIRTTRWSHSDQSLEKNLKGRVSIGCWSGRPMMLSADCFDQSVRGMWSRAKDWDKAHEISHG